MELAPGLFVGGLVIFACLYLWLRQRGQLSPAGEATIPPDLALAASSDAVLIGSEHGELIYVNEPARRWFALDDTQLNLERVAQQAQPSDSLLSLFAGESRNAFELAGRWVEGTSHRLSTGGEIRTVVVLHDLSAGAAASTGSLDLSRAIGVISEIGQTINAGLGVEQVLQALLTIIRKSIPADAGELCLWDEQAQLLEPRGWVGDVAYVLSLSERGGVYKPGEGISGWIERYRKPVFVADRNDPQAVQPLLAAIYQSFIAVPLEIGDRFVGTLELASVATDGFTQADFALLQAVSQPVATAVYNAELYAEQQRRVDEIANLQQVSAQPSVGSDVGPLYASLTERIARLMDADMTGVFLYDERKQALLAEPPFYGLPLQLARNYSIPVLPDTPAEDVFRYRDFWQSNELADEPLTEDLNLSTLVNAAGLNNAMLMPMRVGDERIGMLFVGNKRTHGGFTPNDIRNLRIFAAQATVVVENIRLYQTEQRVNSELAGLQEITQAIGALSHEQEFYSDINARIARLMDIAVSGVLLYDESSHKLVSQTPFYGVDDALVSTYAIDLKPGTALAQIWNTEEYWYSNRVQTDPIVYEAGFAEISAAMGVTHTILAVLSAGGRKLGVVQVANKLNGEDFTDRDARLLLIFATQAAAMIENARLYREVQRRADQAESVRRLSELAGAVLTDTDSLTPMLSEIARLTESPMVFINAYVPERSALILEPRAVYGAELASPLVQDTGALPSDANAALSRRPFVTANLRADMQRVLGYKLIVRDLPMNAAAVVPLAVGDRVLGEMVVANRSLPPYGTDDLRLLATIAVQVSSALERVRLHEATGQNLSRRLQELDSISRVSSELNQTLELDRVLAIIRGEALRGTDASGSTIVLFEPRESGAEPVVNQRVGDDETDLALAPIERAALESLDQPVLVSDYAASALEAKPAAARSAIAMAIVYAEQAVGVLHVYSDSAEQFDSQASTFVVTLAAKAALGYANASRYTENLERSTSLRRRVDQLNQIFELGQMLQSSTDPLTTLEAIAYSVQQSAGFEVVVIALLEDGVYRRVAQAGIPPAAFEASKALAVAPDKLTAIFADEYRRSESYFLPAEKWTQWYTTDVEIFGTSFDGKRSMHPHGPDDWRDGDLLLVPLLASTGVPLGVMVLDRPFENHRPNADALEILEIFAHQAAATVENLRLYQSTIRRTERLSLLNRVSVALAQSLDLQNILNVALTEIAAMTRVESARALVLERQESFARVVVEYPSRDQAPVDVLAFDASPLLTQVSRSVQPILIPDVSAMPDDDPIKRELERRDLTAFLAIPIAVSGRAIGLFELEVTDGSREFESEQIDLSAIIANQAAIAMQNANLLEQTLVRTRDLETLLEAAQATSFTLDLGDVFQNVAQLMLQALDMDDCAIMLYFPVENELDVQIEVSRTEPRPSSEHTRLPLANYPLRQKALEQRQVLIVQRGDPDGDKRELSELSKARSTARMLVPLVVRDQSIGLIVIDLRSQFRAFSHRDSRMAQALSAQAATAIENARLSTETAARVEELLVINDLSRAISSTMDVEAMIGIVRDQVPNLTEAEQVYLALYEPEINRISFPMAVTDGKDDPREPRPLGDDEVSFVIRHRRLLSLGGDFSLDELRRNLGISTAEPNAQAYLAVPLISGDQVLGVLAIANLRDKRVFGLNDQRILTTIGTQIAVALQNARLFNRITTFADDLNKRVEERTQELADERDRLDTLYRITSELARTLDTDRVLTGALEMVVGAVGADEGVIFLIDPQTDRLFNRASFLQNDNLGQPHAAEALGAYLMRTGQQVLIGDLPEEDFWEPTDAEGRQWNSAIGVILETNGMSQGAMVFLSARRHAFTQPQMRLVAASANQVATALNNADLYNLIREQAERLGGMLRSEQEEAEKSAAILESIADGVMLADARGKIILFNSAAVRILGVPRGNVMGQPVAKLATRFSGASRDWIYAISEWASNPQDRKLNELSTTRLELNERILAVQISRVYATEQLIGTVAVFRDVTRDVEVDRMKSEFVSNVSHELRTPMTSIKGYADLLLVGAAGAMSDQQQQFISTIKTNADRLSSLVNDLLNISKIDAGTERMKLEDVDIDVLVESIAAGLRNRSDHDQKPMNIIVDAEPNVPQIRGDREKLSQVLMNVADNAFNYTYAGGTITLRAGLRPGFDQVLISVTDTGIGIPQEFQPRVWGRFERYDDHALVMEVAGTGLGLSIARTLVEMHRGEIWFESEVNKGTTFYVALPIHQVDHDTIRVADMDREQTAL